MTRTFPYLYKVIPYNIIKEVTLPTYELVYNDVPIGVAKVQHVPDDTQWWTKSKVNRNIGKIITVDCATGDVNDLVGLYPHELALVRPIIITKSPILCLREDILICAGFLFVALTETSFLLNGYLKSEMFDKYGKFFYESSTIESFVNKWFESNKSNVSFIIQYLKDGSDQIFYASSKDELFNYISREKIVAPYLIRNLYTGLTICIEE